MTGVEAQRHLRARAQVRGTRRRQPAVGLVQAAPRTDRGQRRGQRKTGRGGVVGGRARDRREPGVGGEGGEGVVDLGVRGQRPVYELDGDAVRAEPLDQAEQRGRRGRPPSGGQCLPHGSLAAAGEHQDLPGRVGDHLVQVVDRTPLLAAGELRGADRAAQPLVALRVTGEQEQVAALGIRHAVLRGGEPQGQLGAEDRADPQLGGGLGEPDHPVHPVVVGQCDGLQTRGGRPPPPAPRDGWRRPGS